MRGLVNCGFCGKRLSPNRPVNTRFCDQSCAADYKEATRDQVDTAMDARLHQTRLRAADERAARGRGVLLDELSAGSEEAARAGHSVVGVLERPRSRATTEASHSRPQRSARRNRGFNPVDESTASSSERAGERDKPAPSQEVQPCVYCGMPASTVDHVTPRALVEKVGDAVEIPARWRRTVPACRECNGLGSDLVFAGVAEKRTYIHRRLRQRHRHLLAAPVWDERQAAELGPTLRSYIEHAQARRWQLLARLRWPSS